VSDVVASAGEMPPSGTWVDPSGSFVAPSFSVSGPGKSRSVRPQPATKRKRKRVRPLAQRERKEERVTGTFLDVMTRLPEQRPLA